MNDPIANQALYLSIGDNNGFVPGFGAALAGDFLIGILKRLRGEPDSPIEEIAEFEVEATKWACLFMGEPYEPNRVYDGRIKNLVQRRVNLRYR